MPSVAMGIPALDGTLGAFEIGSDAVRIKALVAVVWFLQLGHTICALHATYAVTVTFYGQLEHIEHPPLTLSLVSLFSGLLTVVIQTFFAIRIHAVSGRWPIAVACTVSNLVAFAIQIVTLVDIIRSGGLPVLTGELRLLMIADSALIPATNIVITLALCYYLLQYQRRNQFQGTRSMVVILMVWALETSAVTSATSFLQLILFVTRKDLVWTTFFLIHAKLLSNAMLAALNGRKHLRAVHSESGIRYGGSLAARDRPNVTVIEMTNITETFHDADHTRKLQDGRGEAGNTQV
ncbi:hypothetical protein DFH06DRAFT_1346624 [Mycena polygramma]|nr:hypothetical protein DFH06DRAFT_1346621 [Mycena polygramma]KAJ7608941.1 hypothetical protein DFH06DRAFT_1346624 [Mycena polygramma]